LSNAVIPSAVVFQHPDVIETGNLVQLKVKMDKEAARGYLLGYSSFRVISPCPKQKITPTSRSSACVAPPVPVAWKRHRINYLTSPPW
jgi:hypothetical protein